MVSAALLNHKASPETPLGSFFFGFVLILFMVPPESLGLSKEEGKKKFIRHRPGEWGISCWVNMIMQAPKWPRDMRKLLRSQLVPGDFPDIYSVKLIEIRAEVNVGEPGAIEIASV